MVAPPLIDAATLKQRLDAGPAPHSPLVLLDARPDAGAYALAHLRGAQHADLETQLSAARAAGADPARDGRHPLPSIDDWCAQLGRWGIDPATRVIVYDDQAGANAAARAWWMLRAVGHTAVQVLDGGFAAAQAAGLPIDDAPPVVAPQPPYPARDWQLPLADAAAVEVLRHRADAIVLDVRAAARYRGETEPIDPVAGHIPGARNLPYSDHLQEGRFKPATALRAQYETLLDGRDPRCLTVHCGSGVTACHTLLALAIAGLDGARLYVGSWSQWCRQPRPRAGPSNPHSDPRPGAPRH
ncbi:MAG TPA: rhodanese-like domain-containing protein [Solimonas sp.]